MPARSFFNQGGTGPHPDPATHIVPLRLSGRMGVRAGAVSTEADKAQKLLSERTWGFGPPWGHHTP